MAEKGREHGPHSHSHGLSPSCMGRGAFGPARFRRAGKKKTGCPPEFSKFLPCLSLHRETGKRDDYPLARGFVWRTESNSSVHFQHSTSDCDCCIAGACSKQHRINATWKTVNYPSDGEQQHGNGNSPSRGFLSRMAPNHMSL